MSQMKIVVQHAPRFSPSQAEALALERYGLAGRATALPSERDQNFRLDTPEGSFVLKIANTTEREDTLQFQNQALEHLGRRTAAASRDADAASLALPRVVPDGDGRAVGRVTSPSGAEHLVRLLTWVPGRLLAETRPHSRGLLVSLGRALGEMDRAFEGFAHPAMSRPLAWDLAGTRWIAGELDRTADAARRRLLERVLARFEHHAQPILAALPRQVIHNDWNDYNVLVTTSPAPAAPVVAGAVDFGDMLESWAVADLAVACCYAIMGKPDPVAAAAAVVEGYHARRPMSEAELDVLLDLVRARLAISVTMAACQSAEAPDNEYLRVSEQSAWSVLAALDAVSPSWARCVFRHACGLPASATSAAVRRWLSAHRDELGPVVREDLRRSPVAVLDLSVGSLDVPNLADVEQIDRFCTLVNGRIAEAGARAGIGRYDEARLVYVTDLFRHANNWEIENRSVHIGVDVFLPAGAEVLAPLDGLVHSCHNNAGAGDYGPTIILEHTLPAEPLPDEGTATGAGPRPVAPLRFYTLYGHLSTDSLADLAPGVPMKKGSVLARLGDVEVNGGWPPHLHFQVITDMLDRRGDFPGVAAPSERAIWLDLCPDPNLVLGIPENRFPAPEPDARAILAARHRHLGRNLSVSYRRPITAVRGHLQYLFDAEGRRFLDAVNNVPHVGHNHPRVARAAARQLAVLNTNTRYLSPVLAGYVERLASLMPPPLEVCFLVCSGSEANELALRLARACTRRRGVVVLDGAYHGNTSSLVEISPYKFDGPGGGGCPSHVRKVPMPDLYRGAYKADDPRAAARYAAHVGAAARDLEAGEHGLAAFICESLLGCGGQVVLPRGYLAEAYAAVRAAGGVCVADEVQVGFGRVGSHWWGFETQGVVPDIVTLGKPIGNGFPLGAVVTTRAIADGFDNGMEYFNTFGGSQAPCAVGQAVLDVMRDEQLQQRAAVVGARLLAGLEQLKARFPIVGDVRGLGLFIGVELVRDRDTLEPAAAQAAYLADRMRDRGILLSTDGPLHNVLKIKPPLQFSEHDADRLVETLADLLQEDAAQADAAVG